MKVWISRATYQRMADGMGPAERRALDQCVEVYPDDIPPEPFAVDQGRVAQTFAALQDPWQQVVPGLFFASTSPFQERVQERMETHGDAWMRVFEFVSELQESEGTARRYFLNDVVTGVPDDMRGIITTTAPDGTVAGQETRSPLDDMREFMRRWADAPWARRRTIKAGTQACEAFAALASSTVQPRDVHGTVGALAGLTGIPIVPDDDLPPEVWQLVDPKTGEVLYESTVTAHTDQPEPEMHPGPVPGVNPRYANLPGVRMLRAANDRIVAAAADSDPAASDDDQIGSLIRAGVPLDRIGRLTDGTWAYIPPCPAEQPVLHVGMTGPDGTTPVHIDWETADVQESNGQE